MASLKTVCVVSLGSFLALATGFVIASEVRAGDIQDEVPDEGAVDADALAKASTFAGEYTWVGGQKERDGLDAAIEAAMDAVSPMVRNIGRKRLQESNPIPQRLSIAVDGDTVDIRFDGTGHSASLDGTPIKTVSQGDKVKISHRMRGSKLTEFIDGSQGDRRNTFKLGSDGKLTVDVEITSGHLPVPVEYRLTFKRK
jgi:hypothetical protein